MISNYTAKKRKCNLDLPNFLIIIECESLSYRIQHTKLYKRGKFHYLVISQQLTYRTFPRAVVELLLWNKMAPHTENYI